MVRSPLGGGPCRGDSSGGREKGGKKFGYLDRLNLEEDELDIEAGEREREKEIGGLWIRGITVFL